MQHPQRISLDQIHIPEPCPESWATMRGDDRKRFCDRCQKHVHNLSAMSREDAEAVLASEASPCVQMLRDRSGRILHQPTQRGWHRFRPFAMASMLICSLLTLMGCRQTLGGTPLPATRPADDHPDVVGTLGEPVAGMVAVRGRPVAGPTTQPTVPPVSDESK